MANVTVTILQSGRCDDWGRPYVVGNSYPVEFDKARGLWQTGFASVPDTTIFDDDIASGGGFVRYFRFPGFRRSLLASFVANTTASRTGGLVIVTATGHGITTGATYVGFRIFYPGSSNLLAGWYDSIVSIPDANTLTFTAPGPDFASESVNGAAAYTTLTMIAEVPFPADFSPKAGSRITANMFRTGDTTATVKGVRGVISSQQFGYAIVASSPNGVARISAMVAADQFPMNAVPIAGVSCADFTNTASNANIQLINFLIPQTFGIHGVISAGAAFQAIYNATLEIVS